MCALNTRAPSLVLWFVTLPVIGGAKRELVPDWSVCYHFKDKLMQP